MLTTAYLHALLIGSLVMFGLAIVRGPDTPVIEYIIFGATVGAIYLQLYMAYLSLTIKLTGEIMWG